MVVAVAVGPAEEDEVAMIVATAAGAVVTIAVDILLAATIAAAIEVGAGEGTRLTKGDEFLSQCCNGSCLWLWGLYAACMKWAIRLQGLVSFVGKG